MSVTQITSLDQMGYVKITKSTLHLFVVSIPLTHEVTFLQFSLTGCATVL